MSYCIVTSHYYYRFRCIKQVSRPKLNGLYNIAQYNCMSIKGSPIRRLQLFSSSNNPALQLASLTAENERLSSQLYAKNLQLKQMFEQNKLLKLKYHDQIQGYQKTISLMEKQLKDVEIGRQAEFTIIKQRYDKMSVEQSETLKNYHEHQVEFLLKQIASLRADAATRQQKLSLKQKQISSIKHSYQREIQSKIQQINNINRTLMTIQETKNKQIRELANKRELQRSRTSGLVSSTKENHQFMDKQMRKLNEQVLDKTIKIQSQTRQLNKLKKKIQDNERNYLKKVEDLVNEREEENRQRQEHFLKVQKSLKSEILEFKEKQLKLLGNIDTLESKIETLNAEIAHHKQTIGGKQEQIKQLKVSIEKQREQHAKQVTKLLKERKKRSSNLGSSRSLSSSMKDSGEYSGQTPPQTGFALKKMDSVRLPTVKQESPDKSPSKSLQNSHLSDAHQEQQDNVLARAFYQYDTYIQELKKTHSSNIQMLEHKLNEKNKKLQEKQQEVLDILTRFSPLVKIHAQQKSVQEDRMERIQRHWKADLALLQIMLSKYKIKVFE